MSRPRVAVSLALLLAACADEVEVFDENVCTREDTRTIPVWQRTALDVLFVLDRAPSMADDAADLAELARTTDAVVQTIAGGVPDLHVAIVTSDLGGTTSGCGAGDAGVFQGGTRCGLDDAFLRARGLEGGGVGGNFDGTLGDTFACLFDVPLSSCPVSQPLGAAVRALDGSAPGNAGFRRDYAALVVVVVTDSDDATRGANGQLADTSALTAQLLDFVEDPSMLVVASVAAAAAPRLAGLNLPDRTSYTCVCGEWSDALIWLAELPRVPLFAPCLDPRIDLDPVTPGFQVNCASRLADGNGATVAPLPYCDDPGVDRARPCIEPIVADPQACPEGGAMLDISLGDERLPLDIRAELRCEVACEPGA